MRGNENERETYQDDRPQPKPRDGPASIFEADPMITDVFNCSDGDYFGLVLVTNWPVQWINNNNNASAEYDDKSMDRPYQDFLRAVKSCFREEDLTPSSTNNNSNNNSRVLPAVYLYPTMHLHITIAAFVPPIKLPIGDTNNNDNIGSLSEDLRLAKREEALDLVRSASKLPGWPTEPLKLVVDSAQIGTRAGILLWKDLSGGIASMRFCLEKVAALNNNKTTIVPIIPGIIHSTFLRFSSVPKTPGRDVQEAFRSKIDGKLGKEFFRTSTPTTVAGGGDDRNNSAKTPLLLEASTVKLVSESTPFMHIPNDDKHVLWTYQLITKERVSEQVK